MAYTDAFKRDAVNFVITHPNTSQADCARLLGISENAIRAWYVAACGALPSRSRQHLDLTYGVSNEEREVIKLSLLAKARQDAMELLEWHRNNKENIHNNTATHKEINAAPDKDNSPDVTIPASDTASDKENKPEEAVLAPPGNGRGIFRFFKRQPQ